MPASTGSRNRRASRADRRGGLLGSCHYDLAQFTKVAIALKAVEPCSPSSAASMDRKRARHERSRPLAEALGNWLREHYARLRR
jgi:hypothetical protein